MVGAHLGYTDTDMVKALDVPKNDPREVARQIVTAVEKASPKCSPTISAGTSRARLSGPVSGLSPR